MKLLIVEDEVKTGEYLKQGFSEAGFIVDLLHNGLDGYQQIMTEQYDLLILDVMLPDSKCLAGHPSATQARALLKQVYTHVVTIVHSYSRCRTV